MSTFNEISTIEEMRRRLNSDYGVTNAAILEDHHAESNPDILRQALSEWAEDSTEAVCYTHVKNIQYILNSDEPYPFVRQALSDAYEGKDLDEIRY